MNADLILKSTVIFTALDKKTVSGAVVIQGNRIIDVCSAEDADKYIGENTEVRDYGSQLIMPGFVDAHVHYFQAAISASDHMCTDIINSTSEEDCIRMIKDYAASHPDEKRVVGMGWFPANWGDAPLPTKKSLDEAIPDRPAYFIAADVHTMWLNTMALEECGITEDTEPRSGSIGKFENGELNGLLFEPEAMAPALAKAQEFDREVIKELNRSFMKHINACGVTSVSDMSADDYVDSTYEKYAAAKEMDEDGELTCRLHLFTKMAGYTDFSEALRYKKDFSSEKLRISGVKWFVDGVTSTFTGLLLEPYSDKPDTCGIGVPFEPQEAMEKYVIAANKAGLPVRLHCIAEGGVRMALDMYEASLKVNGAHGLNNTVEHIETIHPDDIPRFKELGVIPSMQPAHLPLDANEKIHRLGKERSRWEWAHKSILESGGELAFGTDYPVVDFNPFPSLYAAVARADEKGNPTGINPEEKISLEDALIAYTKGAAKAYSRDDIGILKAGTLADIAVVDCNLFEIPQEKIKDASISLTVMDGKIVYEK